MGFQRWRPYSTLAALEMFGSLVLTSFLLDRRGTSLLQPHIRQPGQHLFDPEPEDQKNAYCCFLDAIGPSVCCIRTQGNFAPVIANKI